MKVYFHTLGCKVNRYETERMLEGLQAIGFVLTEQAETADLVVVNSCTVTAESDRKTRQLVRRYRRRNPNAILLLTGCMPQAFPAEAEELPADIILGNGSQRDVAKAVEAFLQKGTRIVAVSPHQKGERFEVGELRDFSERTRAYMKVEDGCDRGCTYCIIPKARGRVRSRLLTEIEAEATHLAKAGFKELVLVGINLSSYGIDTGHTLADAVAVAAAPAGIERVRLGSLEPDLTDDALLRALREIPEFCPQFHLSLQSGCNATLKRMNRLYTAEEYHRVVEAIRRLWQNASITTDIMVGFVGETEQEFAESVSFAQSIGFLKAHIFPYSLRNGTAAASMTGHIEESIKAERAAKMAAACDAASAEMLQRLCGEIRTVLFERSENGFTEGYSEDYIRVFLPEDDTRCGRICLVRLVEPMADGMRGEICVATE